MRKPYAHLVCPKCGALHYDLYKALTLPIKGARHGKGFKEEFSAPHLAHRCTRCMHVFGSRFPAIGIPKVSFIVAVAEGGDTPGKFVIGANGGLPWAYSQGDMAHFRKKTMGKAVVVGGRTFAESSAFPLPDRQHWVVTRTAKQYENRVSYITDPNSVFSSTITSGEVVVIGGGQIYPLYTDMYSEAWVTYIDSPVTGDTYIDLPLLLKSSNLILAPSDTIESIISDPPYRICHYIMEEPRAQ